MPRTLLEVPAVSSVSDVEYSEKELLLEVDGGKDAGVGAGDGDGCGKGGVSDGDGGDNENKQSDTRHNRVVRLSILLATIALFVYEYPLSSSSMDQGDWHPAQMVPKVGKGETNDALSEFFPWECASDEYLKANPSISNNIVEITEYNTGRSGNRDMMLGHAAAWALFYNMNLRLPKEGFISGFVSTCTTMRNMNINMTEQAKLDVPNKLSEPSMYFWTKSSPPGATSEIHSKRVSQMHNVTRLHTGTNSTHAMGMKCSIDSENSISIHIRSGDITKEAYDIELGVFKVGSVNRNYGQPPVSYFLAALLSAKSMSDILFDTESANKKNSNVQIYVFCEDFSNPVCKHFHTVSYLNPNVHLRSPEYSNTGFLDDLRIIMCSRQIIQSRTTMNNIFGASRAIVFHDFQFDPALELSFENANACILKQEKDKRMCNCKYAIQDEKKRKIYYDEIHQKWTDNSYQRSLMQADYDMIHKCA